jgi:hypothetical protein
MGALKIVGGILAVVGAGLILFLEILYLIDWGFSTDLVMAMILPILALIGGILAIAGKRAGGILALIVGIIWLLMAILINIDVLPTLPDEIFFLLVQYPMFSVFAMYADFTIWFYLTVEIILVFVGGILATAGGSD